MTIVAILGKLAAAARESGRINGKDRMIRRCFQTGCLFKRGKRRETVGKSW